VIGSIEIFSLLAEKLGLSGGAWDWPAAIDLNTIGFAIVGLFVITWLVALAIWHFGNIEERWTAPIKRASVD
jgi:nickel/cobalt transporter (NiCoT) family protein